MSERRYYFDLLVDALNGHLHPKKQTRVSKRKLLELLYRRLESQDCSTNLVDAYAAIHGGTSDRERLVRALPRALTLLRGWMESYYEEHPDCPLRFEIDQRARPTVLVQDGFEEVGLPRLIAEAAEALSNCSTLSAEAEALFHGTAASTYANQLDEVLAKLAVASQRAVKLSAAAKRRL